VKRIGVVLMLALLAAGCGTSADFRCWGGTPVEKPCFCHANPCYL
jgi:hypothetical protein